MVSNYKASYAAAAAQVCAWSFRTPPMCSTPMHPCSPSDLLMVHAVCGLHTVSVIVSITDG